jgi:hypothetical protein
MTGQLPKIPEIPIVQAADRKKSGDRPEIVGSVAVQSSSSVASSRVKARRSSAGTLMPSRAAR